MSATQVDQIGLPSLGIFERIVKVVENIYRICVNIYDSVVDLKNHISDSASHTHPDSGHIYDSSALTYELWDYFIPDGSGFWLNYGEKINIIQHFFSFLIEEEEMHDFFPGLDSNVKNINKFFQSAHFDDDYKKEAFLPELDSNVKSIYKFFEDPYWDTDPKKLTFLPDLDLFIRSGMKDFFTSPTFDTEDKRNSLFPSLHHFLDGGRQTHIRGDHIHNSAINQINDIWEFFNLDTYISRGYNEVERFQLIPDMYEKIKNIHGYKDAYLIPILEGQQLLLGGNIYTHRKEYMIMNVCRNLGRIGANDLRVDFWNDNLYVQDVDLSSDLSSRKKWISCEETGSASLTFDIQATTRDATDMDYLRLAIWLEIPSTPTKSNSYYIPRTMKVYDFHDKATHIRYWSKFRVNGMDDFRVCFQMLKLPSKYQLMSYDSDKYELFKNAWDGPRDVGGVRIGNGNYQFVDECSWSGGSVQDRTYGSYVYRNMSDLLNSGPINIQPLSNMIYMVHD